MKLVSFTATAGDRAVDLAWQTGSETNNLGFNLYRSTSASSPFTRITASLIPGLGNSPEGPCYSYRDSGLANGTTYFYQLEDVETTGRTQRHGPVSATTSSETESSDGESTYGDPSGVVLREIERDASHVLLELLTPGFVAVPTGDGRVRLSIPGLCERERGGRTDISRRGGLSWRPRRGRKVRLTSVQASDELRFPGLRPVTQGMPEIATSDDGTVRPSERAVREGRAFRELFPSEPAHLLGTAFQGEIKKAEVAPFPAALGRERARPVASSRGASRLRGEGSGGDVPRRLERPPSGGLPTRPCPPTGLVAQLVVKDRGLQALAYEDVFPVRPEGMRAAGLRLSRQGEDVAFHVEPDPARFAPGSTALLPERGIRPEPLRQTPCTSSRRASRERSWPSTFCSVRRSAPVDAYYATVRMEKNVYYQAGLLNAPDLWLWDLVVSPVEKSYAFTADHVSAARPAYVSISLQGASDFTDVVDHHVRVSVNGTYLGEASWDGKEPKSLDLEIGPGVIREGANTLELENVGDTGASYSLVFLNRYSVRYPRALVASGGTLEGTLRLVWSGKGGRSPGLQRPPRHDRHYALAARCFAHPDGTELPRGGGPPLPGDLGHAASAGPEDPGKRAQEDREPGGLSPPRPQGLPQRRQAPAGAPTERGTLDD